MHNEIQQITYDSRFCHFVPWIARAPIFTSYARRAGLLLRVPTGVRTEAAREFGADWLRSEGIGVVRVRFPTQRSVDFEYDSSLCGAEVR